MDIINKIKRLFKKKSASPGSILDFVLRGLPLDSNRYETYIWIFASAKKIAETGAQVSFKVVDEKGDNYPKYEDIFKKPSPQNTFRELIEATLGMMTLYGKAFWIIDGYFIYVLDNRFVFNIQQTPSGFSFEVPFKDGWKTYTQDNAVIFYDALATTGLDILQVLNKTSSIGSKIEDLNDNLLKNGGFIPGYFTTENALTPAQRQAIKEEWERSYAGYINAGKPPVLEGGLKLERFGLSPSDMQFSELEKLIIDRVSAVMGVPSVLLNKTDKINYATAKTQKEIFWENTIIPKLSKIEERINYFVMPLMNIKGVKFIFDYTEIKALAEDAESKAKVHDIYVKNGVLTINEVRHRLGLEDVDWGDYYWGNASQVPLASKGIITAPKSIQVMQKQAKQKEDDRTKHWKRFDKLTANMEQRLYKEMRKFFRKQHKEIKQVIEKYLSGEKIAIHTKINEDDLLNNIDWESHITNASEIFTPLLMSFASQGADMVQADLMVESSYDVVNPQTINFIKEHALEVSRTINNTTQSDLRRHIAKAIADAVEAGKSSEDIDHAILDAVDDVFSITEGRAYIIARTETARAVNWGQFEFAKNAGIPLMKEWISARDNVVRPAHQHADGQAVDLNAPFVVDGETLQYPGDPSASAGNTINCRCTVKYIPKEDYNEGPEEPNF